MYFVNDEILYIKVINSIYLLNFNQVLINASLMRTAHAGCAL